MSRGLLIALALALAIPAAATTVVALDAAGLRAQSELVVRARVSASEARWLGQRIVTLHTLELLEELAGELSPAEARSRQLVVGVPGGIVGHIGQRVPGAPELEVGQEWLLYLGPDGGPGGARGIVGVFQGAFRVTRDPAGVRVLPGSDHPGTPAIPADLDALRASLRARP